ncbi:MAG TPA: zinc ribbon domain-containing protein [Terriglobales bacterium]|nr:zinc ribbon domain-containing protein [Terriglobales bacterium]
MPTNSSTSSTTKVILCCAKCGSSMPDGAQACPACGNPVALPAREIPVVELPDSAAPPIRPKHSKRRAFLWIFLGAVLATVIWAVVSDDPYAQGVQELVGWKHDEAILENPFSVAAHNFRYYKFALPEGSTNVALMGQFTVTAEPAKTEPAKTKKNSGKDAGNTVEVFVLSEASFAVWQNGYATSSVYESGRVSQGNVQTELPAGAGIYYLIFSNKFDATSAKDVNATFQLRYKSWLPTWFRQMKNSLWNWLGL